ncbi:MAG: hypothetical protein ACLU2J_05775 [Clostridia bacterium]
MDVNIHPTKLEVKFQDEKRSVYKNKRCNKK